MESWWLSPSDCLADKTHRALAAPAVCEVKHGIEQGVCVSLYI